MTEMPAGRDVARAARALRSALTALGDALAGGNLAGVLAAEPTLSAALASVAAARSSVNGPIDHEQATVLAGELAAARRALARCAALGASLDDLLRGCGLLTTMYDASGAGVAARMHAGFDQKA